jgi:hypothetical protein
MERAEVVGVVVIEDPAIEELGKVAEISLASAAVPVDSPCCCLGMVHPSEPAIIITHGLKSIVVDGLEDIPEEGNSCTDVVDDILAVAIGGIGTFFLW